MTRLWVVTVMAALGRLLAVAGAALSVGAIAGIVAGWLISALRYAPDWNVGLLPVVLPLQVVVAGWVLWGALTSEPPRLLRNLLVAFALTFVLGYGWYFLLGGWGSAPVSMGNLLYLAAAVPVAAAVLAAFALDDREEGGAPGEAISRGVRSGSWAFGAILFAAVAAIVGYASLPPVPPEARAISPPDQPSYPEYLEDEIAAFEGRGDRTTPAFEVTDYWGYEYASTGYGTMAITLLGEDGEVHDTTEGPFSAGEGMGGGEFASGGTFKIKIDADDDARYAVVVCDEAGPHVEMQNEPG
jgi:hypothetical protein